MTGELFIKLPKETSWTDAYTEYGVSLRMDAMAKLMTPAPNKEDVENSSDLENGKRVSRDTEDVRKDERNVNIEVNMTASSESEFLEKYAHFCSAVLDKGYFDLKTIYWPGAVFRFTYLNCTNFQLNLDGIAIFTLALNEPDPTNRGETDSWAG